ncbi:MAG: hypothetical protein ACC654_11765 [Acidimicrobiia bacterium]
MGIARATTVLFAGIAVIAAACSSVPEPTTTIGAAPPGTTTAISNQGGTSEGHTPTDFPGTGPGLFVGDNLNASFPDGVGVQTYLEFALPADIDATTAILRSDRLITSGTPFEDLGPLVAEVVVYDTFGPDLFNLTATGPSAPCLVIGGTTLECDVGSAVQNAASAGQSTVQFRLRFEIPGDNDGVQDLAMFYRTDSNTNEAGLFELVIEG